MDNQQTHKMIHQKNRQKHDEISQNGVIVDFPGYYGETLFTSINSSFEKPVEDAANYLLSSSTSIPENLPPILSDLLSQPKEEILGKLIEYYTRNKLSVLS
jgi:hypothetical protein